jgi:hypothetical protein
MAMLVGSGARRLHALRRSSPWLQRTFFSFPTPGRSLVKSHTETRVVPFSCSEMFDVVADVDRYSEFLPFCVESRVLRRPNDNVMEAALRVGFNIFTESYTSRVLMIRCVSGRLEDARTVLLLGLSELTICGVCFCVATLQTQQDCDQGDRLADVQADREVRRVWELVRLMLTAHGWTGWC